MWVLVSRPEPVHVLVVDDDESIYDLVDVVLASDEDRQFETAWASCFEDGLALMKADQFDVYLLDVELGADNGIELLERARREGCTKPAVILTRRKDRAVDLAAMDAGAADYLTKDLIPVGILGRVLRYAVERDRAQREALFHALHDDLTGLPNRALFLDRLSQAIARRSRDRAHGFTVLFVDLDGFKPINDRHGHAAGDAVLVEVAGRLRELLRGSDSIARFGGDEFTLILDGCSSTAETLPVIERINDSIARPIEFQGRELRIGASIGVHIARDCDRRPEDLLREADTAMYRVKNARQLRRAS